MTAAPAIDVPGSGVDPEDVDAIKRATGEVMDRLTDLVVDLRARYPERWTPDG